MWEIGRKWGHKWWPPIPRFLREVLITQRWAHKLMWRDETWEMSVHQLT